MTRIVALADSHLRSGDPWNSDRLAAWDQVIKEGLATKDVAAWVHAGDVFDTKSAIQDRLDVADRLQQMAAIAPVCVVQGNHEASGDLGIFRRLKAPHPIVVVEYAEVIELPLATGGTASVFAVPYPQKSALVAQGVPPDRVALAADHALDILFMDAAERLNQARARGHLTFMVGHGLVVGARSSTGQPIVGQEIGLSVLHLARLGPILKLLGHIHLPQEIGGAIYVGSGCRLSFGETEAKRYIVAHIADDSSYTIESRHLECPPRYCIEGTLTRDDFIWETKKGPGGPKDEPPKSACPSCAGEGKVDQDDLFDGCGICDGSGEVIDWTGCDVRVQASYAQQERSVLAGAFERVKAIFAGARVFKFEPIAIPDRALRAPEIVQALTLDEKLRGMAKLSGVAWSDRIESCAADLQRTEDGAETIRMVEARLTPLANLDITLEATTA